MLVKRGQKVVKPRCVVKCSWEDKFGTLLDQFDGMSECTIEKIQISTSAKFTDPVHIIPIDAPSSLCDKFKCCHVCISIVCVESPATSSIRSAFDVLMVSSREIVLPSALSPAEGKQLRKDQQFYNDLLGKSFPLSPHIYLH